MYVNVAAQAVGNTATETSLIPPGNGSLVMLASGLQPGNLIRVTARGKWRTAVVPPTLRIRLKLNPGTPVVILDSTATTTVSTTTELSWLMEALLVVANSGAVALMLARGYLHLSTTAIAATSWDLGKNGTAIFDSTADNTLEVTAQWGTADANNNIVCDVFTVETSGA